jgi:ribosome-associated toxin RatA of RatAB toxin-antitoxin module
MREIKRSAIIAQPPGWVFEVINDIESYPSFLPWCTHAKILSRTEREIVATVGVRKGPLHGEFTTRNTLEPDKRITLHLVSGPFETFEGEWLLTPVGQNGCRAELSMRFAFRNRVTGLLFEPQFAQTMTSLVDAFVTRAGT